MTAELTARDPSAARIDAAPGGDPLGDALGDPGRLAALRGLGLLTAPPAEALDRLAGLAARVLQAPVSLVSLVDADHEFLASSVGVPEPWATTRRLPLSHSFCRYVVTDRAPLVVADVRVHPVVRDNAAIADFGVVAYAGVPIAAPGGQVVGSLCVIDFRHRAWTADEVATLVDLAAAVETEIGLRVAVAEARAAETRYRAIFEGAGDAILVTADDGRHTDVNPAACALFGYTREELLARRADDLVVPPPADEGLPGPTCDAGEAWRGSVELRRADGAVVPVEGQSRAVELPGGTERVAVLRDVSERQALERLRRDFVAMVSHDLRTPLAAIKGRVQLMQQRGTYSERTVEIILGQVEQLARLTGDLADAARLEAGRWDLVPAPVDLRELATAAAEQARALRPAGTVVVDLPEEPVVGDWDRGRLDQVLGNLLGNAVKFSPPESAVRVEVTVADGAAWVAVIDHGLGIAPEDLPRLFDRFYRGAATAGVPGLGLGLHIARALVEAHGGRIWAESSPGRGSRFVLTLPLPPGGE